MMSRLLHFKKYLLGSHKMHNALLVAKREYTKVVRKPIFWISTLALPIFIIVISIVSGISSSSADNKLEEFSKEVSVVLIYDESGILSDQLIVPPLQRTDNYDEATKKVASGEADVLLAYKQDVLSTNTIEIQSQDRGLFSSEIFNQQAKQLLIQSILLDLDDPTKIAAINTNFQIDFTSYKDGEVVEGGFERLIIPIGAIIVYLVLIIFSTNYLLQSVSEEKENRMIEIIVSIMRPRELILGKIIGQIGVVLTQMIVLVALGIAAFLAVGLGSSLPIDLSSIQIGPGLIVAAIFYTFSGFFIMASIMVGVGAAMPNYKDAQSFSAVFIVASLFPFYLSASIVTDPSGSIAQFFSYFPLTAPMVMLFRTALGEATTIEVLVSGFVIVIFGGLSYWLAFKLFEFGSLEYNNSVSWSGFFREIRSDFSKK